MSEYIFEGEVIKLNAKDFARWCQLYPKLDLSLELEQIDAEMEHRKETGQNMKSWFVECMKRLYVRNKHEAKNKPVAGNRSTRDISLHEELTDTSWAYDAPPMIKTKQLN